MKNDVRGNDPVPAGGSETLMEIQAVTPPSGLISTVRLRQQGLLMEMGGGNAGRVLRLDGDVVTIGRGAACALCFADATLSRVHARIVRAGNAYLLEDTGSLNGSYVNHVRVTRAPLAHGDRIRLGSGVRLQFLLVNPDEEQVLCHLYEASVRDGLTGVYNRRHLEDSLTAETSFAMRHGTDLCLLMLDLDHFKQVNDTYGHLAGDEILRTVAQVLGGQLRREDVLGRYGGEEFAILVRSVPKESAGVLAERIRKAVEGARAFFDGVELRITVSIGVAGLREAGDPTPSGLVARADEALYRAKDGGRNRVVLAPG